jgi:hypothetical protein
LAEANEGSLRLPQSPILTTSNMSKASSRLCGRSTMIFWQIFATRAGESGLSFLSDRTFFCGRDYRRSFKIRRSSRQRRHHAHARTASVNFSQSNAPGRSNVVLDSPRLYANVPSLPLLAQMRSADRLQKCLLFGVDRTYLGHHETDAFDPTRKLTNLNLSLPPN